MVNSVKIILSWLGTLLIFFSFALNLFFGGIIWVDREQLREMDSYIRYKDSIQLQLMDRIVDENDLRK
jgi:hypothetical protein